VTVLPSFARKDGAALPPMIAAPPVETAASATRTAAQPRCAFEAALDLCPAASASAHRPLSLRLSADSGRSSGRVGAKEFDSSGRSTRRQTSDPADLQHPFGFCASLLSIKEIGLHRAFAFDHERTARLEAEHLAQGPSGRGGHVNTTGQAVAFHAPGGVYGISPDVVEEFMGAKHTGYLRRPC
jgi:hypothetical protein